MHRFGCRRLNLIASAAHNIAPSHAFEGVLRERSVGESLWEAVLPAELRGLPPELAMVDLRASRGRSWLARRSTIATSTPANANSPANISPVGPAPAIATACSVIAPLRPASPASLSFHFRRFWPAAGDYAARPGACRKPPARHKWEVEGVGNRVRRYPRGSPIPTDPFPAGS